MGEIYGPCLTVLRGDVTRVAVRPALVSKSVFSGVVREGRRWDMPGGEE
jgi:hypothetical protein